MLFRRKLFSIFSYSRWELNEIYVYIIIFQMKDHAPLQGEIIQWSTCDVCHTITKYQTVENSRIGFLIICMANITFLWIMCFSANKSELNWIETSLVEWDSDGFFFLTKYGWTIDLNILFSIYSVHFYNLLHLLIIVLKNS